MRLYVGNMPFSMTENDLRETFEQHGTVDSVAIITDRDTGRPRGFGFVEMPDSQAGQNAIEALDNAQVGGRSLKVNEARPRQQRSGGGGRGGYNRW